MKQSQDSKYQQMKDENDKNLTELNDIGTNLSQIIEITNLLQRDENKVFIFQAIKYIKSILLPKKRFENIHQVAKRSEVNV